MSEVGKSETAKREEEVLAFWKDQRIFERSLGKKAPKGEFIFYDGPPFATGLPHHGSLLSSVVKDVFPRYKTMRGYRVPRRWGWDCHGLPIEIEVEKKLGLKSKKDILSLGIDKFNESARSMVLRYVDEWEKYIDRIGRWVDFKNSYKTMDNTYIETVWWVLKQLHGKKMLYEGRKVLMYCPHDETPLAKAEIAMDNTYKDITEEAVTVKFKLKNPVKFGLPENSYVLAWTTTPWTLPGNVALAVAPGITYAFVEKNGEYLVAAADRLPALKLTDSQGTFPGKQLIGAEYEPLYDIPGVRAHKGKKHVILPADFVTTTEGTGIVHTAVMYGEDDFTLGTKENLPMVQLLNSNATYNDQAPEFIRSEYIKKAEKLIKADLEQKNLIFAKENHTHSYPHCHRCGTPLIYNAVASWFINIQKVKSKMLKENAHINWVPAHLKEGRFKHIVENAPDWTISRNRFWASPLPMWKEKGGKGLMIVGSVEELLKKVKKSGNKYFVMRHGEAQSNVSHIFDASGRADNHLTERGRQGVLESILEFKKQNDIDMVVVSPILRTRETAKIVQNALDLPDSAVMVDERLRELQVGSFDGKSVAEWEAQFHHQGVAFNEVPEGSETYTQVRKRVGDLIFELERRYTGKRILVVTHDLPAWLLNTIANRLTIEQSMAESSTEVFLHVGEIKELNFVPYPHNALYEPDLHRPYIDTIVLQDEKGNTYERIPEVIDCWVESGSMPYASNHYPFENKHVFNPERFFGLLPKGFPADFIAEYIAQTRTWFYYMHTIGVLLFSRHAFRNVISTGTILAGDGSKMSKSKGNFTDPLIVMDKYGADAIRFYMMGSVVMSGEDLNFRDEEVRETHNRVVGILWNSYKFFELYKHERKEGVDALRSTHVLDKWILSLLGKTTKDVTDALEFYDTPTACRVLRAFVEDYSTWYVRRSRDRVKGQNEEDKQFALTVQREVLLTLSQLLAPITPFIAESIYRSVGGEKDSVHLSRWPEPVPTDSKLLVEMERVREIASLGLQEREKAGIKIRQPLSRAAVRSLPGDIGLKAVLAEELNVKEVVEDPNINSEVELDTMLTTELREEGVVRSLVRRVQEWRKEQGLTIADRPTYTLFVSPEEKDVAEKYRKEITRETNLKHLDITLS
ncbi:MAG TPA: class I tRNA ligase family protein [Candidatus Paceibacterota bacterium]|nr:class I tRNA ligase family protein [Candidatus Paceibacterota bacterium]